MYMVEHFFLFNGKIFPSSSGVISPENRSFRYGDGLFETMKVLKGGIVNGSFHFQRMFEGLALLEFDIPQSFSEDFLKAEIQRLLSKNKNGDNVRVRINIFRGNGGIFDNENLKPNYLIESWELPGEEGLNTNGLVIDIYTGARKNCDVFANVKSNNFLPYVMAGIFAKKNRINDALLLNIRGNICDSVIANIFLVKSREIITPPLSEGCVAGVMRRWMMERFSLPGFTISEKVITEEDLGRAEEIFLTNSIRYLRWVGRFRDKSYGNTVAREIYQHILTTI